ncbi:DUF1905 domain-containing protein [Novosphingobium sp. YAF33]|uniref:DUF1905 domain-containing protein n=1 Tax=Novosphingobium sp. YAF33 TaxID=3233082 RepID=UPI003F9D98DC
MPTIVRAGEAIARTVVAIDWFAMPLDTSPLARFTFVGEVFEWRGPAPFFFVAVPTECVDEVRYAARIASYGWGVVPVHAVVNEIPFTTSLFPKGNSYLLPVKAAVRKAGSINLADRVTVEIQITAKRDFDERRPTI